MQKTRKNIGFTLIEMIVALTILSIIMLSIFVVYFNIIQSNRKLKLTRVLQENSRNIIESLASEIREKGIDYSLYGTAGYESSEYSGSGNTELYIKDSGVYCMMKIGTPGICDSTCITDAKGCYLGRANSSIELSDDKVLVNNLRFFISGKPNSTISNIDKEGKVTILFDLGIAPGKGIDSEMAKASSIHIQTTITEKMYKNMNN